VVPATSCSSAIALCHMWWPMASVLVYTLHPACKVTVFQVAWCSMDYTMVQFYCSTTRLGFCVCMGVSMTSNLKFTVYSIHFNLTSHCFLGRLIFMISIGGKERTALRSLILAWRRHTESLDLHLTAHQCSTLKPVLSRT
jgi:hypothetical protein